MTKNTIKYSTQYQHLLAMTEKVTANTRVDYKMSFFNKVSFVKIFKDVFRRTSGTLFDLNAKCKRSKRQEFHLQFYFNTIQFVCFVMQQYLKLLHDFTVDDMSKFFLFALYEMGTLPVYKG